MRVYRHRIAGEETTVRFVENQDDLQEFEQWSSSQARGPLAVDTEATGLDIFSPSFRLRTVQFGTRSQAWVFPVERAHYLRATVRERLHSMRHLVIHNAAFDMLVLDQHLDTPLESLAPRVTDTRLLAHLRDPRRRDEGGTGLRLKDLAAELVDPAAPDTETGLHQVFRELGYTTASGWAHIPVDHPTYVLYAGLDVILTARVHHQLAEEIHSRGLTRLAAFEHRVALVCARMQRRGFLCDVDYLRNLSGRLKQDQHQHERAAAGYGVTSVNSARQVADALDGMGERLTAHTASGARQVDKTVLLPLADLDRDWQRIGARDPNPLADAVLRAKRASKWRTTYAEAITHSLDANNRIHPSINTLQARTARMSITGPPLQQLPAGDSTIRRALIAEPGCLVGSVDYSAIEMRVLAALSGDSAMMQAIRSGVDLHDFTAAELYGPQWTAKDRKVAKWIGFGKVYGGGLDTLCRQTGLPQTDVKRTVAAYDRTFRGVSRYSQRLIDRGRYGSTDLITPSGRVLPVDRSRLYAATNYMVQSTARDVFAQALVDLDAAGLADFLRLPVHDEVVFVAPEDQAREVATEIQRVMTVDDFFGIPLTTEAELYGPAWTPDATRFMRTGNQAWYAKEGDGWTPLTETTTALAA